MPGRRNGRTIEPDDVVRQAVNRARGILTQGETEALRRSSVRIDALGDMATRYISGDVVIDGGLDVDGSLRVRFDDGTNAYVVNTAAAGILSIQNATSLAFYTGEATGEYYRIGRNGHIVVGGTVPSIAAGAAAGTSPTVAITGRDHFGRIQVGVGTSPGTGTLATVTFANAYTSPAEAVGVLMWPADSDAAATGSARVYVNAASATLADFPIAVTGSALSASTTYFWYYATWGYVA